MCLFCFSATLEGLFKMEKVYSSFFSSMAKLSYLISGLDYWGTKLLSVCDKRDGLLMIVSGSSASI